MDFTRDQAKEILMREVELAHEIEALEEEVMECRELFLQGVKYLEDIAQPDQQGEVIYFTEADFRKCAQAEEIIAKCKLLEETRAELSGMQTYLCDVWKRK